MQKCTRCKKADGVKKYGFLRGSQRYYCKNCNFHFVEESEKPIPAKKKNHQITIVDVAKQLGVSISTVSKALNNKSDISPETKRMVLKVAMELDYRPNLLAQSLHLGKTHTIGIIIPDVEHPFFASVLSGIQQFAVDTGYRIIVCHSNESQSIEILNTETMIDCRVDGLLVSHSKETNSYDHIRHLMNKNIPVVHYDRVSYELNTPKVIMQDIEGSIQLTEHLISQGCKRIGALFGPKNMLISQKRFEGYKIALQRNGLEYDEKLVVFSNKIKNVGRETLDYFMNLDYPPDGIFAMMYRNAVEMMSEAKKVGIRIPDDIAFVGFGDDILAELFEPSLTVFNNFPTKIGESAIRMLIDFIDNKDAYIPYTKTIPGELVIRKSSMRSSVLV